MRFCDVVLALTLAAVGAVTAALIVAVAWTFVAWWFGLVMALTVILFVVYLYGTLSGAP